jgi:hypothetical protein
MIHKFKDYNRAEQREIVFEIIRQKYLYEPQLNNFGENCKYISGIIKSFESGQLDKDDLANFLEDFYKKNEKSIAEEVLFYFFIISEGVAEQTKKSRYKLVCEAIKKIINVDAIQSTIEPPEEKMGKPEGGSNGGFTMISYSKYPSPEGYTPPPPPPPLHTFKNPYTSKDFKSICDYVRYKIFEEIIGNKIETLEDLGDLDPAYSFIPDSDEFINFPQCEDEDGDKEDLDFENPGDFIINNENSITFGGGGDWQEPQTFSFKLEKNGKIKAFDIEDGYSDNENYDAEGIIKIISKLFGLNRKDYNPESTDPNDLVTLYKDMIANKDFKLNPEPKSTTKIQTEDCVTEIINYFKGKKTNSGSPLLDAKLWKRLSKTGSKDSIKREFENKKTGDKVFVMSTETEIFDIVEVNAAKSNNPTNIEEKLQTTLKELQEEFEEDFDDFGGMYYNSKQHSVWLDVCDGFEPEDEVEKKFLKVVSKVIIQYEKDPYSDENKIDSDWKEIKDTPISNKVQKFEDFDDEFITEFPFKKVFGCATIYRKKSFDDDFDGEWWTDTSAKDEMKGYNKYSLPKGERIAIGDQDWDNGDAKISEIIVITKDTFYWNYDSGWISDGIITIEIDRHKGHVPAQEPVDLLETGYENGGGEEINNKKAIKKMVEKYKLDHVLMSM